MAITVVNHTMTQEKKIPMEFARKAFFRSNPKRYPAILPAYTPVPGSGTRTKIIKPQKPYFFTLLPAPDFALRPTKIAAFL